jgi:hypothetical protein
MRVRVIPLIWLATSLLAACSLFEKTPPQVTEGQRGTYQGLLIIEDNVKSILAEYEKDCKATISYHENFIYEQKIDVLRKDASLSKEDKSAKIAELESARDKEIQDTFAKIEAKRTKMQTQFEATITPVKQLVESVYNYLSTTPIVIDNVDYWIAKIKKVADGQ